MSWVWARMVGPGSGSIFLAAVIAVLCVHAKKSTKDNRFDFIMFTQLWPVTSCLDWEESGPGHSCTIDGPQKEWTIHGIWPTRNEEIGPSFCNNSKPFDIKALEPLIPELQVKWLDVRKESGPDKHGFWKHEWLKHGTCAMQIPSMDTEFKYFNKALELHQKYNIFKLLADSQIVPNKRYDPKVVVEKLSRRLNALSANVAVNCAFDKESGEKLFYELIVCLDKDFNQIGCEETAGGLYGSCKKHLMMYPVLPGGKGKRAVLPWIFLVFFIVLVGAICYYYYRKRTAYSRFGSSTNLISERL